MTKVDTLGEACEPAQQSRAAIETRSVENCSPLNALPATASEIGHPQCAEEQAQINSDTSVLL